MMTVDVEDGRATAISSDPTTVHAGVPCAKVQPLVERVYEPERILHTR